jgi:uncharacterized protein YbjQ (UPF0145 family)
MLAADRVVTFDRIDGFRVVESFGAVRGDATVGGGLLRATFRTLGQFMGFAPADYLTDAERGRTAALAVLQERAAHLGADAVIGVRFDAVERADGSTRVSASGEAVRVEPERVESGPGA